MMLSHEITSLYFNINVHFIKLKMFLPLLSTPRHQVESMVTVL